MASLRGHRAVAERTPLVQRNAERATVRLRRQQLPWAELNVEPGRQRDAVA